MTDEEMAEERATKFVEINFNEPDNYGSEKEIGYFSYNAGFLAGLKAGRPKWHKVASGDLPKGEKYGRDGVHRDIYLRDRYGKIYTGNYFPKDENHKEDCFAVEILDWGLRGSQFCKKEQISDWCEIPEYTEE